MHQNIALPWEKYDQTLPVCCVSVTPCSKEMLVVMMCGGTYNGTP